jgi:integrase
VPSGKGLAAGAKAVIAAYSPCSVSDEAVAFARQVVADAQPESPGRARNLLFAASRLAVFGQSVGLAAEPDVLLCECVIERFALAGCTTLSPATRRTLRTNLRALRLALEAHPQPRPVPLPRERAKAPYSDAEIEGYLRLACAQSTEARRMRSSALVCLGAGAGVVGGELRHVRGVDVVQRSGGVVVGVAGKRARVVPVLRRFHEPLLVAAVFAGERFIAGAGAPGRRNLTDSLCAALSADPSLGRLRAGRLRSTWLSACAQAIGLHAFMRAAGVRCCQRLGDIAASLPVVEEAQMVALLGSSR